MNVCEVLQKYYAMDYNFKDLVVINSGLFCEYIERVSKELKDQYNEKYGDSFSSFHLVFNKIHFCNIKSMSDFFEKHKNILTKRVEEYIDMGVYTSSRIFRLPECTKKGQQRHLQIISYDHNFQDAMLPAISDDSVLIPTTKKDLEHKSILYSIMRLHKWSRNYLFPDPAPAIFCHLKLVL